MRLFVVCFSCIILVFSIHSCGTGLQIPKDQLEILDANFSGTFQEESFLHYDNNKPHTRVQSISKLFRSKDSIRNGITLHFENENTLLLSFESDHGYQEKCYAGKFSHRGYFEIFLDRTNIRIPPLIPLVFSNIHIDRIRIGFTKKGHLLIHGYWENSGSILFLGTGGGYKGKYYFKKTD